MKLTTRGFTLVELMIVIAIIGILATALFPSLAGYLKRGRDASRTSHMKDISTAIGAYFSDSETYPISTASGCVNTGVLDAEYIPNPLIDPVSLRNNGCGANTLYGYASGSGYASAPQFVLSAYFENEYGGNYAMGSTGGALVNLIGTGQFTFTERTDLDVVGTVRKGNGAGYLIYK